MILDLFAGPGGWDVGAADLGLHPVGLEIDPHAVATRYAAGHATWEQPVDLVTDEQLTALAGTVQGLIASPPCQDFSAAGKRAGIDGDRGDLMWQVPRYVEALRPRWVACEQVPPALAWYELFAHEMRAAGYSVWTGVLNAADFGVPQTRRRAFLLASLDRAVQPPEPTHAEGGEAAGLFTAERLPWITMAEALGWTHGRVGFPRKDDRGDSPDGYRERDWRGVNEPSFVVTEKARSWMLNTGRDWKPGGTRDDAQVIDPAEVPAPTVTGLSGGQWLLRPGSKDHAAIRNTDEPAPTVAFGHDASAWVWERPSTTIVGSFSPEVVAAPGYRKAGDPPRQDTPGSVKITPAQAATLQGFPDGYPWTGPKTAVFQQIGNAVVPAVAAAVLGALTA